MLAGPFLNYLWPANPFFQYLWDYIQTYPFGVRRSVAKNIRRRERNDVRSVLRKTDEILFITKRKGDRHPLNTSHL